jgi:hypothetical protein
MSIINEALKKTEEHIQEKAQKRVDSLNKKPVFKNILLYILIILCGFFLSNIILNLLGRKVKPAGIPEKIVLPSKQIEVVPLPTPSTLPDTEAEKPQPDKPVFVLNGIFFSDNDGYALINNEIVRENDTIDKARVSKITVDSVELNQEGKITTLRTHR